MGNTPSINWDVSNPNDSGGLDYDAIGDPWAWDDTEGLLLEALEEAYRAAHGNGSEASGNQSAGRSEQARSGANLSGISKTQDQDGSEPSEDDGGDGASPVLAGISFAIPDEPTEAHKVRSGRKASQPTTDTPLPSFRIDFTLGTRDDVSAIPLRNGMLADDGQRPEKADTGGHRQGRPIIRIPAKRGTTPDLRAIIPPDADAYDDDDILDSILSLEVPENPSPDEMTLIKEELSLLLELRDRQRQLNGLEEQRRRIIGPDE